MGSNTNAIIRSAERAFEGQRWPNKKKKSYSHPHFMPWLQRSYFVLFLTISVYASVESSKRCTMNESPSLINHTLVLFLSLNKVFLFYFRIDFLNSSGSSFQPRQKSSVILWCLGNITNTTKKTPKKPKTKKTKPNSDDERAFAYDARRFNLFSLPLGSIL